MAWSGWPVTSESFVNKWDVISQLWFATRERAIAARTAAETWAPNGVWPRESTWHDSGTLTGASDTGSGGTLTDSTKTWTNAGTCTGSKWVDRVCTPATGLPEDYDVVIYPTCDASSTDHRGVVQLTITANTNTTLTVGAEVYDWIAAGFLASVSALNGKKYSIIKSGGYSWATRFPVHPNDQEYWANYTAPSSATTSSLTDDNAYWKTNAFAGKDLLVWANDSRLKRVSIVSNTHDTLAFASQTWTPSGAFCIVDAGDKAWPYREGTDTNRIPWSCFQWYDGAKLQYYTVLPDDTIAGINQAAPTVTFNQHDGVNCVSTSPTAFDTDVWSDFDELCSPGETCYSPYLFRTLRHLQVFLAAVCTAFVDEDFSGPSSNFPILTAATFFQSAGINAGTGTCGTFGGGVMPITGYSAPLSPLSVYVATKNADGDVVESGLGTLTGGDLSGGGVTAASNGLSIVISPGFTRSIPREFRLMFDKTIFIPDLDGADPVDPPEDTGGCIGVGTWTTHTKSTGYRGHSNQGVTTDSSEAFVTNEYGRYVGDNAADPTVITLDNVADGKLALTDYWANFYVGRHEHEQQVVLDAQAGGIATGGSNFYVEDTDQNWWTDWYETEHASGVMRTETGTATGGSTTTLQDTAKAGNCFWVAATGRWVGFILEMLTGPNAGERRPITGMSGTTLTVSPAFPNAVLALDTYRIREPAYELNRWKGRTLRIYLTGQGLKEVTITHSDDTRLYFATQPYSVAPGERYKIVEPRLGSVWKWNGSAWIKPTGADAVRTGVVTPADFHSNQNENCETIVKKYGNVMKGDVITPELLNEIRDAIRVLNRTWHNISWTEDPGTGSENNYKFAQVGSGHSPPAGNWTTLFNYGGAPPPTNGLTQNWAATGATGQVGAPFKYIWGQYHGTQAAPTSDFIAESENRYAYAECDIYNGLCPIDNTVFFYAYTTNGHETYPDGVDGCIDAVSHGHGSNLDSFKILFDDFGIDLEEQMWVSWGSGKGPSSSLNRVSDALGDTTHTLPSAPTEPGDCTASNHEKFSYKGFEVTDAMAVASWDFEYD